MSFNLKHAKTHNFSNKKGGLKHGGILSSKLKILQEEEVEQEDDIEMQIANVGEVLYRWIAPEFEAYEKSTRWYLMFAAFIIAMTAYALITNSPIMAITFILIGIVGYIHLQKNPRIINFSITSKGIVADREMYAYENIHSFWIFYDHPHARTISLHTKASMLPFIHIPIRDEDPVFLRELMLKNIPEIKQDAGLIDAIERAFHV